MLANAGTYANKKRKKPVLKHKKPADVDEVVKSNPSKRHRDRLNGELDRLTDLLPFSEDVRSRLDKLSVLRLSVGYLRVKSYFKATMKNSSSSSLMFPGLNGQNGNSPNTAGYSEGDLLLQALNGFVMVVTSGGLVFYASTTIKDYLGFHQSDVVHQSVFELIHTDDRAMFRQQLHFALNPPPGGVGDDVSQSCGTTVMYSPEQLPPENSSFLERSFVCRFRCLLDNSSGFLALKFQGRLKYVHGQSVFRDDRTCNKPQLALFTIAMPVQPPSIVEIRAKMLLFQTKHKLDFTPMAIDSRGKIILGYSETELCMKGSGYQFIHAADMMHCADNHIRMIKTGETGLTVFRLLSKSGGWVWVKANAKLIYKGGRPEFIIAYQRALVNAEGEEYLRQRRLQLPFSSTTGEAVLYDTGPTVDVTHFQFNKMFSNKDTNENVAPGSLLDCFLRQDEKAYTQIVPPPLPVDQVFMDSEALVSVHSDTWQENGPAAARGDPLVVKDEAKRSVMAVIDSLEKMAQNGDFGAALQNLELDSEELVEWENALKRLSQDEDHQNNVRSELDSILTNDIFEYIDSVLFKEKGEDCLNARTPKCLAANNNNQQDPFTQAARFPAPQLCEPQLFQTLSLDHTNSPMNGLCAHQQDTGQSLLESAQIFSCTQKPSHQGSLIAQSDANLPPLQQLQLQDIFSPSIELPELAVPGASAADTLAPFPSCEKVSISHMGCPQGISAQMQPGQLLPCPQNNFQRPAMASGGPLLQSSVEPPNNVASGVMDILPPLIPCNDLSSSTTPSIPIPFASARLQGSSPFGRHNHQVQQWSQSQQQKLPHAPIMQNGHEPITVCHSQTSESQTFPHSRLWPRSITGLNHTQQGGLACGQAATQSSCMFDQHFSSSPAGDDMLAFSGPSGLREADTSLDQSLPQGSCRFQWSSGELVVGASAVNQQNASAVSPSEHALNIQHFLKNPRQTQDERLSAELNGIFAAPARDVAMYLTQ
ncbi:aryl hydrocarbon receptor-like isoform X2 [Xiphias gladius]|uniref:aryl hydrocarbon receptor-like isoform X2 n=1 Tax=Xiphias gladius TaxID=8245 RepID=UPI001A994423|nr:aryl hydrocarbon receptor-like isoform X2 [Xiphias gladius]